MFFSMADAIVFFKDLDADLLVIFQRGLGQVDYSLVIAPVVADLCTTPVALSAPPNSYQNNSQS